MIAYCTTHALSHQLGVVAVPGRRPDRSEPTRDCPGARRTRDALRAGPHRGPQIRGEEWINGASSDGCNAVVERAIAVGRGTEPCRQTGGAGARKVLRSCAGAKARVKPADGVGFRVLPSR